MEWGEKKNTEITINKYQKKKKKVFPEDFWWCLPDPEVMALYCLMLKIHTLVFLSSLLFGQFLQDVPVLGSTVS